MQKSMKLKPIAMTKEISKPLTSNPKTPFLKLPLASPVTCGKNKENVCAALSGIQQVNIVRIDGDGTTKSSLQDKINNAKDSIKSMKQQIGRIQSKSAEL